MLTASSIALQKTCADCFVFIAALVYSPVQNMFVTLELPIMHCWLCTGAGWPNISWAAFDVWLQHAVGWQTSLQCQEAHHATQQYAVSNPCSVFENGGHWLDEHSIQLALPVVTAAA